MFSKRAQIYAMGRPDDLRTEDASETDASWKAEEAPE